MNGQQRDYVVPAIVATIVLVAIVAGTLVALALAKRDDILMLAGFLSTAIVAPAAAALYPLIKSANRAAAAQESTAESVEQIRHRLNGEFSAEIRQAIASGVAPLRAEMAAINARLERGDRRFEEQSREISDIKHQIDQLVSCETKPEGT